MPNRRPEEALRNYLRSFGVCIAIACVGSAISCKSTVVPDYDFDTTQTTQVWMFQTFVPSTGEYQNAKVVVKGCTKSQCTGATLESVPPYEWRTVFGNGANACTMYWHISGQITGDLVSFTLNGSSCETTIQGRSGTGGKLNGNFGAATGTVGPNTMSWNGFTTLFNASNDPTPKAINGSQNWAAIICGTPQFECPFPP